MSRFDWPPRGENRREEDRRAPRNDPRPREDFGQADYSEDYRYDAAARGGYPADAPMGDAREEGGRPDYSSEWSYDRERGRPREIRTGQGDVGGGHSEDRDRDEREPRSWMDRAGAFLAGEDEGRVRRRRGPSDRVLWAVIVERLKNQRSLDLTDVEVLVDNAEVTLNGTVRRKEDKRRIEDISDIDGVRHVQNNLRVRDRGHWTFL